MTPKVLDRRMPALLGFLFIAGCAAATTPPDDGTGGSAGVGGFGIQGASPPPGLAGSVATGAGGTTVVVTGSGGTVSASGSASVGMGGANIAGAAPAGGATSGTGGTTGTGGAGKAGAASGTGGAAGAAGPCTIGSGTSTATDTGGFVTAGMWHGYAFTAKGGAGTSITPADYAMLTAGSALCACGTVKGTTDYSGTAMIGINLNQEAGGTAVGTITPSGMGISITVTGAGTTPLRLQIQGPMGDTDASQRWCADLPAAGGMIPWGNFQFECWEGGHRTPFNGMAPISAAMVQVPGGTTDISFNFCVTAVAGG